MAVWFQNYICETKTYLKSGEFHLYNTWSFLVSYTQQLLILLIWIKLIWIDI